MMNNKQTWNVAMAVVALFLTAVGDWSGRSSGAHASSLSDCRYVLDHSKACKNYITGKEDGVTDVCCHGLRKLVRKTAGNVEQQKDVCSCSAKIFERLKGVQEDRLALLSSNCRARFPFTLAKSPDCDK
ncbi:unnamed protein product [Linum trigynum]|uniref:Bifunctional inhibitor/plant lipid transfer protein/seed storage helical domain-containing protein n=1 Tax=Linum trigynum TaxID=586398 RepID=A0AAV2D8I7_9ROSI